MQKEDLSILHIYGDNIIECQRTLEIILNGFRINESYCKVSLKKNNLIAPHYLVLTPTQNYEIVLFPGTHRNRWNKDIYTDFILDKGGIISEGADAIVTRFDDGKEVVILGLEFSAALPAGNNAWQRSGRAYSFSLADVPYFYVCEFGGNELHKNGTVKSPRFPNPALILSYILNSLRNDIPNMLVYQQSPVASAEVIKEFGNLLDGGLNLSNIIYSILNNKDEETLYLERIINNNIQIMLKIAKNQNESKIAYEIQNNIADFDLDIVLEIVKEEKRSWKKKIMKNKYYSTVTDLFNSLSEYSYGIFSKDLPFSLLPSENKKQFIKDLKNIYPEEAITKISEWLVDKEDIVICYINGFKPGGNDSRPDRGLVPFARMIMGEKIPILSIIFGPVPTHYYDKLENDIDSLALSNGLWSSVINFSNAVFIDSKTLPKYEPRSYIINTEEKILSKAVEDIDDIIINLYPERFGENDVDTLIHLFFTELVNGVFESFCNPPGGDWSGISILKDTVEYRYVSLPRLSTNSKRPDSVYQFNHDGKTILLSIESKETLNSLKREGKVGELMNVYLKDLLERPANARKNSDDIIWTEDNSTYLDINYYTRKSGVAFISKSSSSIELDSLNDILLKTESNLVIIVYFDKIEFKTFVYFYTNDNVLFDFFQQHITSIEFNEETQFILIDPITGDEIISKS